MLKEFIQHIQETTRPQIEKMDGKTFAVTAEGNVVEIKAPAVHMDALPLQSLDALVKLVQSEASKEESPLYITVPNHLTARCFGRASAKAPWRQVYYEANATDVPGWGEKVELGFEAAQIALRTRFQETPDTIYAMKLLSDISCGAKVIYNDSGIATTVTQQKGISLQTNEPIRPLIALRPYRTFQEVDQPESIFLLRLSDRGVSFTEADGGMWKLKARETVKVFLEERLAEEAKSGAVIIAL